MCSVTFIPRSKGFCLGMNRDESLAREVARPARLFRAGSRQAIYPSESSGGTWIAVNDAGLCIALINWYSAAHKMPKERKKKRVSISRGAVIPRAIAASSCAEVETLLFRMSLQYTMPFRLLTFDAGEESIREFRWDGAVLDVLPHPWQSRDWFSSGFDEPEAQLWRSCVCREARLQKDAGSRPWLRRLYGSHSPAPGPFSVCMHRSDAATVSYTEVSVGAAGIEMYYNGGSLCQTPASDKSSNVTMACKESVHATTN